MNCPDNVNLMYSSSAELNVNSQIIFVLPTAVALRRQLETVAALYLFYQ